MNWLASQPMNQLAAAWRNEALGTCTGATIGSDGCLITCYAMLGLTTPPTVNGLMKATGHYYKGCLADTFDVRAIGLSAAPALVGVTNAYQSTPFPPAELARLWAHVAGGNSAIACVDFDPGTPQFNQHWVALVGAYGTEGERDFVVNEPWGGRQVSFLRRFGWKPGQASLEVLQRTLVRAVLYAEPGKRLTVAVANADGRQTSRATPPARALKEAGLG